MERSMFAFIWRNSKRQQIIALLVTFASFPFLYFSLDLPKIIINKAIQGDADKFPSEKFGFTLDVFGTELYTFDGVSMGQITYLMVLCFMFLTLVFINGGFKMKINTFKGVMAERLLRRLRFDLLSHTLRFPLPQFQKTSQGEIVSMVVQEVEPLGGFFGDAYTLVAFQGGMFATIMAFMFAQDWRIGLAAFAMIPVQGYIIPKMQKKINLLGKERVKQARALSGRISEVAGGVQDVHANDASGFVLSDIGGRLGKIFIIRFEIYQRKFFMKFVNNFLGQLTPFFFYSIGGYLAITGELTVGALVAALAAYKDLAAPWKELLNYYQQLADAKIKYDAVVSQFEPEGLLPVDQQSNAPAEIPRLNQTISANNMTFTDDDGVRIIDGANFTIDAKSKVAFLSSNGTAKQTLSQLLGRLLKPTNGKLTVGQDNMSDLHEAVTGRRISVMTADPVFFNTTIANNVFLGLQHVPPEETDVDDERRTEIEEAIASGNSPYKFDLDWIDYGQSELENHNQLMQRTTELVQQFDLDEDMYTLGLRQTIDPAANPELAEKILTARGRMREELNRLHLSDLVRPYDFDEYNTYASVADNILFGEPVGPKFAHETLGANKVILSVLDEFNLRPTFLDIGVRCAELMVELFQDLPPGHAFFEQYSFIDEDLLPDLKSILRQVKQTGAENLVGQDREIVMSLPFKLTVQRHRLGLLDDNLQATLVKVRQRLQEAHPEIYEKDVQFYDAETYNTGLNLLDNVLFGKIVHGRSDANTRVLEALTGVVEELGLWKDIIATAFEFRAGIGGSKLSAAQRQKMGLLRAVLKKPDLLIFNEALSALDAEKQRQLTLRLAEDLPDATFVAVGTEPPAGIDFDQVFDIQNGRIVETGDTVRAEPAAAEEEAESDGDGDLGAETRLLRELPLFANLDSSKLRLLAFTSDRKTYHPGEIVVQQGDYGDAAYVVLDGSAEVVLEGDSGEETKLYTMEAGQVLGELAMLCDTPRSATVRAVTDLTALKLNRDVFVELARQDPFFSFEMTRDLGQRLLRTTAELNSRR
ncbi:MAG: cyclic nucleotide-binding domain-containing protein [Alphaproteobacteria bacterium]